MLLVSLLAVTLAGPPWEGLGPGLRYAAAIAEAAGQEGTFYVVGTDQTSSTGIFRITDRGRSWEKLADGPPAEYYVGLWSDSLEPDRLFAGTFHAGFAFFTAYLYRSVDGGRTWERRQSILGSTSCSVAVDPSRPDTLYVTYSGAGLFFRSDDGGDSFVELTTPYPGAPLEFAPDGALLAITPYSVLESRDQGVTWSVRFSPKTGCPPLTTIAFDPTNAERIFVGAGTQGGTGCGQILRSADGGESWTETASVDGPVADLAIDVSRPELVYAATAPYTAPPLGRVLVSGDDGAHWQDLELPAALAATRVIVEDEGRRVYAATTTGLYARNLRRTRLADKRWLLVR